MGAPRPAHDLRRVPHAAGRLRDRALRVHRGQPARHRGHPARRPCRRPAAVEAARTAGRDRAHGRAAPGRAGDAGAARVVRRRRTTRAARPCLAASPRPAPSHGLPPPSDVVPARLHPPGHGTVLDARRAEPSGAGSLTASLEALLGSRGSRMRLGERRVGELGEGVPLHDPPAMQRDTPGGRPERIIPRPSEVRVTTSPTAGPRSLSPVTAVPGSQVWTATPRVPRRLTVTAEPGAACTHRTRASCIDAAAAGVRPS